ncbi:MAG TPA: hypothetical protein VMS12_09670, partial [Thermoanaerobaculia bacterium]|nr:hypothetical protein [Thermoanaerobaculia bacterium]
SGPGAAGRRLAVATECPTCGAPLDFSEGSNAIRCGHCRSNLLVTGRGQILSYAISPRASEKKVRVAARRLAGDRGATVSDPRLFFVPFYRITGQEFGWRRPAPKLKMSRTLSESTGDTSRELEWGGRWGGDYRGSFAELLLEAGLALFERLTRVKERTGDRELKQSRPAIPTPVRPPLFTFAGSEPLEFGHRHIEKNFAAGGGEGLGVYSLGVRSSVLRLELFDAARLAGSGSLLSVGLDPAIALERGLMGGDGSVVSRQTAGVVVSLIYFPFWIARIEEKSGPRVVAIDGVTGGVASPNVSGSMFESGGDPASRVTSQVAGFRPLVCPNCGWDLPVHAEDVIFFCNSCLRAWKIEGNELKGISHQIASLKDGFQVSSDDLYLPFWVVDATLHEDRRKVFVPAFRYRQLKHLQMLGTRISQLQPEVTTIAEPLCPVHGAHYDEADGAGIARFLHAGLVPSKDHPDVSASFSSPRLLWIPFSRKGNFLFDPFLGSNLFANLLH